MQLQSDLREEELSVLSQRWGFSLSRKGSFQEGWPSALYSQKWSGSCRGGRKFGSEGVLAII